MTPIDPLAASMLMVGGCLLGWWLRGHLAARQAPAATARPLAQVEIMFLQSSVRTDVVLQRDQLEVLANGVGYYLVPLASQRVH